MHLSLPSVAAGPSARAATELADDLARGALSAVQLAASCLARVAGIDPLIGSVLAVAPDVLDQAAASDRRRAEGRVGALEGLPVLIKDNVAVSGLPTTAGSRALARSMPPDALVVRRLRRAGAVVLGKTNLSEWGNVRSTRPTSGWSGVGGQTRNPHVLDRTPSGSSSGSAAAVAAGLVPLGVGTESDGSIISPAGSCGIVGFKPTHDAVACQGLVPVWSGQDVVGPMTRSVADAALLHSVLTDTGAWRPTPGALSGARLGLWRPPEATAESEAVLDAACAALRAEGTEIVPVDLPTHRIPPRQDAALLARFREEIDAYLASAPGALVRSLAELVHFNRSDQVELSRFGQENLELALDLPAVDPRAYAFQHARRTATARALIDGVLGEHRLDAIVTLSNGPAPRIAYGSGDGPEILTTTPAAVAGYPMVTTPAGFVGPLPVGVTFIGTARSDARLLALAHAFEQVTAALRAPRLLPTAG